MRQGFYRGDAAMRDAQQDRQRLAETEVDTMVAWVQAMEGAIPAFVSECLHLWIEQMASDLTGVRVAVAQAEIERVATCAHTMQGSCLALGASQLHALAAQLETEALSGTLARAETKGQELTELYERVCAVLRERVPR
jgi:HPt (histidine-containing phosphotransfer) domain-containing protein